MFCTGFKPSGIIIMLLWWLLLLQLVVMMTMIKGMLMPILVSHHYNYHRESWSDVHGLQIIANTRILLIACCWLRAMARLQERVDTANGNEGQHLACYEYNASLVRLHFLCLWRWPNIEKILWLMSLTSRVHDYIKPCGVRRVLLCKTKRQYLWLFALHGSIQQAQNICITFVQCRTNIEDVEPTLYKCYTHVLCLLGYMPWYNETAPLVRTLLSNILWHQVCFNPGMTCKRHSHQNWSVFILLPIHPCLSYWLQGLCWQTKMHFPAIAPSHGQNSCLGSCDASWQQNDIAVKDTENIIKIINKFYVTMIGWNSWGLMFLAQVQNLMLLCIIFLPIASRIAMIHCKDACLINDVI